MFCGGLKLATNRLLKELAELTGSLPPLVEKVGPVAENLCEWQAVMLGPKGTVYHGGKFTLSIRFSGTYPATPPKVQFVTKIFHCNISSRGMICLDILKEGKWSPALTVGSLLTSIASLLNECNPDDPLQPTVATMYRNIKGKHDEIAKKWTERFAV